MSKKRIISIICILLVAVTVIMGAGKISRESEAFAVNFLEKYYNITDYETYNYIRSNPLSNEFTTERLSNEIYGEYFTEKGMKEFVEDGMLGLLEELSFSNSCTVALDKVSLEKVIDERDNFEIAYDYDASVVVTDAEGKSHSVSQHGRVVIDTKDELKISSFKVIDSYSVISAVSSMY
ncbi:MAG: hypothetical protein E7218_02600 [Anaerofustis stercorihominis]|nr:hypothetical protein [Anaerofustis stercorihominis]